MTILNVIFAFLHLSEDIAMKKSIFFEKTKLDPRDLIKVDDMVVKKVLSNFMNILKPTSKMLKKKWNKKWNKKME